jgi:nucleoside-diphosphate-sugar epimerase
MNVLVTGSASGFAQLLLARLAADPGIDLILGVDQRESAFTHERYVQVVLDLRSPQLARVLQGMQAVIHLAPAAGDDAAARGEILEAAQNLYTRALAADTHHLIHLSSALVYGAQADIAIDEQHARGAVPGCAAAEALQAVEAWLDVFEAEHPARRLVRLRPHWLVGPHVDSVLARLLRQHLTLRQPTETQLQCVHEEDVVEAILRALHSKVRGAFNLACKESVTLTALHRQARWLRLPMAARLLAHRLDTAPGCIEALARSLVLDTARARSELGWRPRYDRAREIVRHR